jgi:NADH-quinone oxidoreductase subunit A
MVSTSFIVYFIAIILLTITMLLVSHLLNPKVPTRTNNEPFESGIVGQGSTDIRWNINYFLVAISFVIFDIEAVFLYIWAIVVMEAGWYGFAITSFFIFTLLIALLYEIKQGAFLWGERTTVKNVQNQLSKEA